MGTKRFGVGTIYVVGVAEGVARVGCGKRWIANVCECAG